MSRRRIALDRLKQATMEAQPSDEVWHTLSRRISEQKVIPIIGGSVRTEMVFDISYEEEPAEGEGSGANSDSADNGNADSNGANNGSASHGGDEHEMTVEEEITDAWATSISYPMPDSFKVARVAQFNRVMSDDEEQAKRKYLDFQKQILLALAQEDIGPDKYDELHSQLNEWGFADIVSELGYPKFADPEQDPLRILAKLPLPIYVTTSYYDFLERALRAENKEPRTQVCFWPGAPMNVQDEHIPDPTFKPDPKNPLVFHLHGLETYPKTLVLSEDDYMDFVIRISQDTDTSNPLIPPVLWESVTDASLILLGYRLQDWDFRVLFRGIINAKHSRLRNRSFVIQLEPDELGEISNHAAAKRYFEAYFEPSKFSVHWGDAPSFVDKLWDEWNKYRRGQA
jgi:hypothetical protein